MRILLFDWHAGGHHGLYVGRFAEILHTGADVVAAVPESSADRLRDAPLEILSLGADRPAVDTSRHFSSETRRTARREVRLLSGAIRDSGAQVAVHMFADGVLRWLMREEPLDARLVLCLFRPRRHYPSEFGTRLSPKGLAAAAVFEALLARWRRRPDAHAVLTLDEVAAELWARRPGAPARWLPEPWIEPEAPVADPGWGERSGCALFGALTERKGIELLAAALERVSSPPSVVLAGAVEPGYEARLHEQVRRMEAAGAVVDLQARWHSEEEGLEVLRRARCAVMPYQDHFGMSRVLLEAATVGTPVLVHAHGLLGHLVGTHRIGRAVDCADPGALAAALEDLTAGEGPAAAPEDLHRFASRYSRAAFEQALHAAVPELRRAPAGP
jgi:hypothetical protein